MLGEVAGAEEASEKSAARRGRRREEREGVGLGEAGVEHGVGAAGNRVLGGPGWGEERGGFWVGGARHSFGEMPRRG